MANADLPGYFLSILDDFRRLRECSRVRFPESLGRPLRFLGDVFQLSPFFICHVSSVNYGLRWVFSLLSDLSVRPYRTALSSLLVTQVVSRHFSSTFVRVDCSTCRLAFTRRYASFIHFSSLTSVKGRLSRIFSPSVGLRSLIGLLPVIARMTLHFPQYLPILCRSFKVALQSESTSSVSSRCVQPLHR